MKQVLLVFLGGGVGSVARFILGKYLNSTNDGIPYGTFAANIIGSLLIGLILGYAAKSNSLSQSQIALLATGFCGGFTTFSTFAYENHVFLKSGDPFQFFLYTALSFIIGLGAVFFGIWLSKLI
ncbi:fluoride efflux transporter CrcB [Spongiivirga citrea]|uniref:Fluoride-specific ion channel FluC n=1 Tax=Spongiivirga citrea TaxID=1481457 RepID=A0A6M0CL02_9FLAO|nr:fluoride efflux transporter CrcB [Spongiivirga citrea]NER18571.1 fluoride efflux transporter CrcB [Spongiivirga citrea]